MPGHLLFANDRREVEARDSISVEQRGESIWSDAPRNPRYQQTDVNQAIARVGEG